MPIPPHCRAGTRHARVEAHSPGGKCRNMVSMGTGMHTPLDDWVGHSIVGAAVNMPHGWHWAWHTGEHACQCTAKLCHWDTASVGTAYPPDMVVAGASVPMPIWAVLGHDTQRNRHVHSTEWKGWDTAGMKIGPCHHVVTLGKQMRATGKPRLLYNGTRTRHACEPASLSFHVVVALGHGESTNRRTQGHTWWHWDMTGVRTGMPELLHCEAGPRHRCEHVCPHHQRPVLVTAGVQTGEWGPPHGRPGMWQLCVCKSEPFCYGRYTLSMNRPACPPTG